MSLRRNSLMAICTIIVAATLCSCDHLPVYSHFEHIAKEGWNREDTSHFDIPLKEQGLYDITLSVRATNLYPYTQLKLIVRHNDKTRILPVKTDTITLDITDAEGNMLGNGTSVHQYTVRLLPVPITAADTLSLNVAHIMRKQTLPGITEIGLTIDKK